MPLSLNGEPIDQDTHIHPKQSFFSFLRGKAKAPDIDLIPYPDNCHRDRVSINTQTDGRDVYGSQITSDPECQAHGISWTEDGTPKLSPHLSGEYHSLPIEHRVYGTTELTRAMYEALGAMDVLQQHQNSILAIVLDDSSDQLSEAQLILKRHNAQRDKYYVGRFSPSVEETLLFYYQFEQLNKDHQYPIVFILDGLLDTSKEIYLGTDVAKIIHYMVHTYGWKMPFFMGKSQMPEYNTDLLKLFPDYYLGEFTFLDPFLTLERKITATRSAEPQ